MKSFWGLIPKYLIKNKKRNFFVAISIVISITLITSLSVVISTFQQSKASQIIDDEGGVYDLTMFCHYNNKKFMDKLNKNNIIDNKTIFISVGDSEIPDSKYSIQINGYDKDAGKIFNFKVMSGHYPQKDNEIALESWVVNEMKPVPKIGDKINLTSAIKMGEKEFNMKNEFTLVGTFEHKFNNNIQKNIAKGYVCRDFAEKKVPNNFKFYNEYLNLKKDTSIKSGFRTLSSQVDNNKVSIKINYDKEFVTRGLKVFNYISIILYCVICVISSVLIYNIFNTAVFQRIKEFGMLRAIGCCSSQIMGLVIGEGLLLGCIFIPLSILVGNLVSKGVMTLFSDTNYLDNLLFIPKDAVILSFIFGFLSILLGTYSSAKKASKVSPMEAINSNSIKFNSSKIKDEKNVLEKKGKFSKNMAYINIKRNKNKLVTTVFSLTLSIILFMLVNYIINSIDPIRGLKNKMGGDFVITSNESLIGDKELKRIEKIDGIKSVSKAREDEKFVKMPREKITDEGIKYLEKKSKQIMYIKENLMKEIYGFHAQICGYDKEDLKKFNDKLESGKIEFNNSKDKPTVILAQNLNYNNVTDLKVGDSIEVEVPVYENGKFFHNSTKELIIGAILKENSYIIDDGMLTTAIIVDDETIKNYLGVYGYKKVKINIDKHGDYNHIENKLKDMVKNSRGLSLISYKEELERAKKQNMKFSLILYSLVFIVALVSVVNIFNVMSMNVMLRKREFGMLRAIGMGKDEVNSMIRNEGLTYGLYSVIWGITVGVIFTYLFYRGTRRVLTAGMQWSFPTITVVFTSFVVLAICVLAAINASRKVYSDSIVDSIRGVE